MVLLEEDCNSEDESQLEEGEPHHILGYRGVREANFDVDIVVLTLVDARDDPRRYSIPCNSIRVCFNDDNRKRSQPLTKRRKQFDDDIWCEPAIAREKEAGTVQRNLSRMNHVGATDSPTDLSWCGLL